MINRDIKAMGFENGYNESDIVLFGAPMDMTISYKTGTRFAPHSIREVSEAVETYSIYQDKDLDDIPLYDDGDINLSYADIEDSLVKIEKMATELLMDDKIPVMIGGEHLVTYPAVKAACSKYKGLKLIHLDAHADLRESYNGVRNSHACVIRRIWEELGDDSIYQFGIRSGTREEFDFADKHTSLSKYNLDNINETIKKLGRQPVYLTIDLDILDPSIMPGVGNPEPGGIDYVSLQKALIELTALNIVCVDFVELSPANDKSNISSITAFKLIREVVLGIYNS